MFYEKRYLQFNDLVFDGYDMISDYDEPLQYKGSSQTYSYGHGSYRPLKSDYLYVSERQVNMTITLKLKKIPCEYRKFYIQFAEQELGRAGKLWAIKNGEVLWANAVVSNIRTVNNGRQDIVVYDLEFIIPGGVWHKADKQRTFVLPYDVCSLMDCKGFEEYDPCVMNESDGGDCCESCIERKAIEARRDRCDCCCENDLTADMALCYHTNELQQFYGCDTPYQLVYSCTAAEKFSRERALGQRLCAESVCDNAIIAGRFYSDTDIPTDDVTITLFGDMKNPWININGNTNIIEGEYHGELRIEPSGDVYYKPSECCDGGELLDPSVWIIPKGQNYGWLVNPRLNSVIIHMNECCPQTGLACVYIDASSITA